MLVAVLALASGCGAGIERQAADGAAGGDAGAPEAGGPPADGAGDAAGDGAPHDVAPAEAAADALSVDAGADGAAAVTLTPDWLPESPLVAQPIPSTADRYVATTGSDSNPGTLAEPFQTMQKAVNVAQPGSVILVRGGTYHQRTVVAPANSGSAGRYITLAAYPGETVTLDGTGVALPSGLVGLLEIDGSYYRVSGFTIQDVGGTEAQMGILAQNGSHIVIDNNHTMRTPSAGIGAWYADSIIIRGNQVQDGRTTGSQECLSLNGTSNFEVSYNVVWNTQTWSQACEGIDVKNGSTNGRVVGNVAHDLPLECIYVDAYDAATHDIDIYANLTFNCSMGIALTAEVAGTLENVRVFDNLIHDTFFIGIGFPAWGGSGNQGAISGVSIYNNTIDNRRAPYAVNPTGLYFAYPSLSNITVVNNIIATNGTGFTFETAVNSFTASHNLVSASVVSSGMAGFSDPDLIQGEPLFRDASGGDYHLGGASPAVDTGTDVISLLFDFEGTPRPQGAAIDIGAFEFRP
jgi:nitrous oxidase accessory protein NosD